MINILDKVSAIFKKGEVHIKDEILLTYSQSTHKLYLFLSFLKSLAYAYVGLEIWNQIKATALFLW